jgi:hypothetical protein
MSKIFETNSEIIDLVDKKFNETILSELGIKIKVMSLTKSKEMVKVSGANATTLFLTKNDDLVCLYIYEKAFERLSEQDREILIEGALSNVSYDEAKDRIIIDNSRYGELVRMRKKYPEYIDIIEESQLDIEGISIEEKEVKEAEKEAKKNKVR